MPLRTGPRPATPAPHAGLTYHRLERLVLLLTKQTLSFLSKFNIRAGIAFLSQPRFLERREDLFTEAPSSPKAEDYGRPSGWEKREVGF